MNIIGMLQRLFLRRAVNWGIRKGTDAVASRQPGGGTKASKAQAKATRENVKRARQAARLTRRIGR